MNLNIKPIILVPHNKYNTSLGAFMIKLMKDPYILQPLVEIASMTNATMVFNDFGAVNGSSNIVYNDPETPRGFTNTYWLEQAIIANEGPEAPKKLNISSRLSIQLPFSGSNIIKLNLYCVLINICIYYY